MTLPLDGKLQRYYKQYSKSLVNVMSTKEGRMVVYHFIYIICGVNAPMMTGNSHTFFNLGRREAGISLSKNLNSDCPELFDLMITECRKGCDE